MVFNLLKILTFGLFFTFIQASAQTIWEEHFVIPNKGIWGDDDGTTLHHDFTDINNWAIVFSELNIVSTNDYAKTVTTSGGRFEVRDVDGEILWRSEWIKTTDFHNIKIKLTASETGSGANTNNKYLKAFFRLNGGDEILFNTNGINEGNWGKNSVEQNGLEADSIQIIVYMANFYSADKVILDEVIVSGNRIDDIPLCITDVKVENINLLAVYFNEPINQESVIADSFKIYNEATDQFVNVLSAVLSSKQNNLVYLEILISEDIKQKLEVKGISDLQGNISLKLIYSFNYLPPVGLFDVVINEIMADPIPSQNLPEYEYIEIYNRAGFPVSTKNWLLGVNDSEKKIDEVFLSPGGYKVFGPTSSVNEMALWTEVIPVSGFPSLINKGAIVQIFNGQNQLIDSVFYSAEWGIDEEKDAGGWSLERIDPDRFCGASGNWDYSVASDGGTPGSENSIRGENEDIIAPFVTLANAISSNSVKIQFNEKMEMSLSSNLQNYFVADGIGNPKTVEQLSDTDLLLTFNKNFQEDRIYKLGTNNLIDECGNVLEYSEYNIWWSIAYPGEVVINELLFNPFDECVDFIEVYNLSEKRLNASQFYLANSTDTVSLNIENDSDNSEMNTGEYLCFTTDKDCILNNYKCCNENVVEVSKLPSMPNTEGYIALLNSAFQVVDGVFYAEENHTQIFTDVEGISLERISTEQPSSNFNNWQSAAETCGFATPGCQNSQSGKPGHPTIVLEPKYFSPNYDGYNDFLSIKYELGKSGYVANIWIYDTTGRQLLKLASNQLLGTNGTLQWNGEDETGQKLPIGAYIVVTELFDFKGNVNQFKNVCVLTDIFE